jgi:two-component system, response regulator / RNA-binding antiterminator
VHQTLSRLASSPVFTEADAPLVVVDRSFTIRAANPAYLTVTARTADELLGVGIFEAFPDNPDDPEADGVARLTASFEVVFRESCRHRMALQRYDIPAPGSGPDPGPDPGPDRAFVRKFWDPVTSPLRDDRGRTVGAMLHVEDVTDILDPILSAASHAPPGVVAESFAWNRLVSALVRETLAHADTRTERNQLQHALDSRIVLEQAKGVLVATLHCSPEEAFTALRHRARSTSSRIHDVARAVVQGGTWPPMQPGPGDDEPRSPRSV